MPAQIRYTVLLNEEGGMLDDLMVARHVPQAAGSLYIVVNGATKEDDFQLIGKQAGERARLERADQCALMALQGPEAAAVMADFFPHAADLGFMTFAGGVWNDHCVMFSRSGYTGEDGYEILVPPKRPSPSTRRCSPTPA